eukprot:CAMPEP_0182866948 /NCGR_PEP_ID=MMETSP0034_2-20130328/8462_1 /TAXON_ID=156128 /ORGANISM="Nephroselmis pyriformis, Strain CCMP717" /LENGTH=214 /DNA_ID=CAMNT_0024999281 /DNA_START=95 /DNA_END=739 /DNA_ORIENTATION=+
MYTRKISLAAPRHTGHSTGTLDALADCTSAPAHALQRHTWPQGLTHSVLGASMHTVHTAPSSSPVVGVPPHAPLDDDPGASPPPPRTGEKEGCAGGGGAPAGGGACSCCALLSSSLNVSTKLVVALVACALAAAALCWMWYFWSRMRASACTLVKPSAARFSAACPAAWSFCSIWYFSLSFFAFSLATTAFSLALERALASIRARSRGSGPLRA